MKIAVASEGRTVDSSVSAWGGRAPYYLIFEDKELKEVWVNPFSRGGGGAGWSVAHMLAEKGVEKVILANIGPNMEVALQEKGIQVEIASGPVKEILGL